MGQGPQRCRCPCRLCLEVAWKRLLSPRDSGSPYWCPKIFRATYSYPRCYSFNWNGEGVYPSWRSRPRSRGGEGQREEALCQVKGCCPGEANRGRELGSWPLGQGCSFFSAKPQWRPSCWSLAPRVFFFCKTIYSRSVFILFLFKDMMCTRNVLSLLLNENALLFVFCSFAWCDLNFIA